MIYRNFLESAGHEVTEALDGSDGISMQKELPFDLIITDIVMPIKDGLETITELVKEFPKIKIIAVSNGGQYGDILYLNLAKQFGAKNILNKPVEREELLNAVNNCLAEC